MAARCDDGCFLPSVAAGPGDGGAPGSAEAAGGSAASDRGGAAAAAGGGGAAVVGGDGAAAAGGGGAAAAGAGAGLAGAVAALSLGRGETASSAVLQAGETLAALRLRHSSASRVPGLTPVQFDMKSERQEARIAEICSDVGCCAEAESVAPITSPPASSKGTVRQQLSQQ